MPKRPKNIRFTPLYRMYLALALIFAVVCIGTAGFMIIEGWSFLDSLYMTLATISTLGMKTTDILIIHSGGRIWVIDDSRGGCGRAGTFDIRETKSEPENCLVT